MPVMRFIICLQHNMTVACFNEMQLHNRSQLFSKSPVNTIHLRNGLLLLGQSQKDDSVNGVSVRLLLTLL